MQRSDGRYLVTCSMTEQDYAQLQLVMERMNRRTMSDCLRALVLDAAKNFLPTTSPVENAATTRRATAANR